MASEKITNIVEEIKTLTIIELADLVKAVEEGNYCKILKWQHS